MNSIIALLLVGMQKWYNNINTAFEKHQHTWIQQNPLKKDGNHSTISLRVRKLNDVIKSQGFFYAYGYVQQPVKKVLYRYKITEIKYSNGDKLPPPDITAPVFDATYDVSQGKSNENDYTYPLWLYVKEYERIEAKDISDFVKASDNEPIKAAPRLAHIEIIDNYCPNIYKDGVSPEKILPVEPSISFERDLRDFLLNKLSAIEDGLTLFEQGVEYKLSTGRADILCYDKDNGIVVVELKVGETGIETYGQIKMYIAAVEKDVAKGKKVRGIIIAKGFDDKLVITASRDREILLMRYSVSFKIEQIVNQ